MKRTPLQRKTPLRRAGPTGERSEHPQAKGPRTYRCRCGKAFVQRSTLHTACSPKCAERKVAADKKAAKRAERETDQARRQAFKTLRQLIAEAQVAFNAYIRARDAGKPCICCGKPFEPQKVGGSMDAGHYLARSIAPQHRFNEANVFGQRKNCNRPGGTTRAAFRAGVIARIGLAAVEALEADVAVKKWTREHLEWIKTHYRAKKRELDRAAASGDLQTT